MSALIASGLTSELVRPRVHPDSRIRLTTVDRAVSHMPVHNLLVFGGGPSVEALRNALIQVLEHHPDFAGRLHRQGIAEYFLCSGQGVLLEVQDIDATIEDIDFDQPTHVSALCATECPTSAVQDGDEPLIRFRISRLRDGAQVFATCTVHSLTDGGGLTLFLTNLANQLVGEPLLPVDLERPELPNSLKDGWAGLRSRQSLIMRNMSTFVLESGRVVGSGVVERVRDLLPRSRQLDATSVAVPASAVSVRRVAIDCGDVEALRRKHGLVLGHVLNAMVLKAMAAVPLSETASHIIYMPILDIRGRHYGDDYSGNAVVVGVAQVPRDQLVAEPLQKTARGLFADNMKLLNKQSMREYISLARFFKAQVLFRMLRHEVCVMIDNVSELSLTRIDFGFGAPVDYFMPPPTDIWVPFIYICKAPRGGLVFQIADPGDRLADFEKELARIVHQEVAQRPALEPHEVTNKPC